MCIRDSSRRYTLRLMEVLWDLAPINSTQLVAACKERLSWSKSTTYTVLRLSLIHI